METQPILVLEDATVLPTNTQQEIQKHSLDGPSVSTTVEEKAPHGTDQVVKRRCTSRRPESFPDLLGCGYTSDKDREYLHGDCMLEEDNVHVVETTHEYF